MTHGMHIFRGCWCDAEIRVVVTTDYRSWEIQHGPNPEARMVIDRRELAEAPVVTVCDRMIPVPVAVWFARVHQHESESPPFFDGSLEAAIIAWLGPSQVGETAEP